MSSSADKSGKWLLRLEDLIQSIRSQDMWTCEPLRSMRVASAEPDKGALALHSYSQYVRRFIIIMCDVLSKVPAADDRFWSLADNLHDELGGFEGIQKAHGRLIAGVLSRPDRIPPQVWENCARCMDDSEGDLFKSFTRLPWPLNLFALGPGTESISDLFLEPIESWSTEAMKDLPEVREYFALHRPEVEASHQLEIVRVLATELESMSPAEARQLFSEGEEIARTTANRHFEAASLCWRIAQASSVAD